MAGGIRGITVKIGGDTTELGRSLTEATTKSTALQRELRGVNSLLKMDPGNVTLLTQKADLLKDAISQTTNKLNDLIEVQKKVDSDEVEMTEEEYRNLEREIASTEQKLKGLNDELKDFGSVGAQRVAQVGEKFKEAGASVEDVGKKVSALSAVTGAVLGGSIMSASNYEDALAKVSTIADTSKESMSDLSAEIMALSNQTGVSANEIADATYNAISAGQDTADAVSFVSNATALAKAGFTDTASSIDILTTIMNAYGLEADKVGQVSDMLIQTQNKGKTTVAELSSSMGKVIPTANSMNVGLEQLTASYAIMTSKGIATAESTTYINSMLNELGKSGTKASDALKDYVGFSFQQLIDNGNSLGDVLLILQEYADKTGVSFMDLWGSSEAGKAGLTLISDGADAFNASVADMLDSTGATSQAMDQLQTPSQKAKVALNQLKNAGIDLGSTALSALAPLIEKISEAIQKLTEWFSGLSPTVKQIILVVLALVTALGPALIIIGKLMTAVGQIMTLAPKIVTAVKGIGTVLSGLSAPILAVVAVVGVLVGAFVSLWKNNEDFRNKILEIWGKIVESFTSFFSAISERLSGLGLDFSTIKETISAIWTGLCEFLAPIFEGAFNQVSVILDTVLNIIVGILDVFIGLFTGNWSKAWDGIKTIFSSVINLIKGTLESWTTAIKGVINTFLGWFGTNWSNVWNTIKTTVSNIVGSIKTTVTDGFNRTKDTIFTLVTNIKDKIVGTFSNIKDTFSGIGRNVIEGIKNGIAGAVSGLYDSIKSALSGLVDKAKSALGIHSPSKIFADVIGKQIPAGVAVGIDDNTDTAIDAVDDMANNLANRDFDFNGATINRQLTTTFKHDGGANSPGAEVVSELKAIKDKLDRLKIVLDRGEVVGGLIDTIDEYYGDKNDKLARGW